MSDTVGPECEGCRWTRNEMAKIRAKLVKAESEVQCINIVAFQAQEMAKEISAKLDKAEKAIGDTQDFLKYLLDGNTQIDSELFDAVKEFVKD